MTTHLGVRPNALHIHGDQRLVFNPETQDPSVITKTPRSPGPNKLSSFFGWKTSSPIAEVSPSTYSGRSNSPNPSPAPSLPPHSPHSLPPSHKPLPRAIDVPKANADINAAYFADTGFPLPPQTGSASAQIAEMDEELREVSSELAGSIRRELELEDLVDKLQLEAQQGPELSRRTSDYFSDSGTSSIRYPLSEVGGAKTDDVAKLKRILEQEKAQFKLKMSQKLQDERTRRKMLEQHIQQLGDQLQHVGSRIGKEKAKSNRVQVDDERARSSNVAGRVRDLENALDDVRRRLLEERRGKENLEDLLTALRDETQQHRDERDNLRDEVVPQLQARVDGLEGESLEYQQLAYENARMQQELQSLRNVNPNQQLTDENARMQQELQSLRNVNPNQQLMDENTRMQQELQSLRNENTTLMNARRLQLEMQQNPRFTSIPEEDNLSPLSPGLKTDLTRSDSGARRNIMDGLIKGGALARSTSVSVKERESRESLADRVKDIEVQRDALHTALKRLLDRQNYHANEHDKKIRALELERDRALQNHSPRRMGYEREVLRGEISQLRRRADDALMQKWQCEKGLSGLKMDLDRAEQETSSLRSLLQEHDILIPEPPNRHSQEIENGSHATSASLERAYKELRATQALSISKLRELWGEAPSSADDADTAKTMDLLLRSMSDAEAERDYAQKQAELYRAQAESLQEAESFHTGENAGLADQLRASASRVERLASQVRVQLEANRELRVRLAEAIGRGEREQKTSASRINSMQGKLKTLEDKLMVAQQHSEEAFAQHEEEVRELHENHNMQLQRLKGGLRAPTIFSPKSPISPMFSPRLDKTTSGAGMSMTEALRTQILERKVVELEGALGDADKEMEEVVSRMNMAQIEVMELQSARYVLTYL